MLPVVRCRDHCLEQGVIVRAVRDIMVLAPPLIVTEEQIDRIVETARSALDAVARDRPRRTVPFHPRGLPPMSGTPMQDTRGLAAPGLRRLSPPRSPAVAVLRTIAAAAILCLAAGALAALSSAAAEPKRGGTLVVAGAGGLRHLNPAVQSGSQAGLGVQLFAGLVRLDDRFEPEPYLAERWEISEDGLSYTFHLARGARFHDGVPVAGIATMMLSTLNERGREMATTWQLVDAWLMLIAEEKLGAESGRAVRRRRRRWSKVRKRQIVAETHGPGASVRMVARRCELNANQVFKWRLCGASINVLNLQNLEVTVASLRQLAPQQAGSDDGAQNLRRASADREHARVPHHALQRQVA